MAGNFIKPSRALKNVRLIIMYGKVSLTKEIKLTAPWFKRDSARIIGKVTGDTSSVELLLKADFEL